MGESTSFQKLSMSTTISELILATTEYTKTKYTKIGDEACSAIAVSAVKKGWVAFGADGFLTFKPEIATIAPRLAPPVQITGAMSDAQKHQAYLAQRARNSETLPTPKATPQLPTYRGDEPLETGDNLSDRAKLSNALKMSARYRSAKEIRDQQLKESNEHADEIRERASKMGGT